MSSHADQKRIWEEEHRQPKILQPMDSMEPSQGVILFWEWLENQKKNVYSCKGIEIGCGKGRNSIFLAQKGVHMTSIDFSPTAIEVAKERSAAFPSINSHFAIMDATETWPFADGSFDLGIDCFALTDIESSEGRAFARSEYHRVLKSQGLLLVYASSTDCPYHQSLIEQSPGAEPGTFLHPLTGKFEKSYDREELIDAYAPMRLLESRLIEKKGIFGGKEYLCRNHWMVFEK